MGCASSSNPYATPTQGVGGGTGATRNQHGNMGHTENKEKKVSVKQEQGQVKLTRGSEMRSPGDLTKMALEGDIDMKCPSPTKIVRIFTSSTFTDTKNERNMLMERAYPQVKEHCRRLGYEFQVVDMRWGVRDEATDDHMTTELCMKELKLCQELSTGPNFVTLLSHKYGYSAFPRVIELDDFVSLVLNMDSEDNKQLFRRWYTLDRNAVPPAFVLSPVSSRLPDFTSPDGEKKKQAKQIWWDESENMQYVLGVTASKVFSTDKARKYIMSVTEAEITEGLLLAEHPSKHILWFKRDIEDIERQPSSYLLSRYIECTGPDEKWQNARKLLKDLKYNKITKTLPPDRIKNYSVKWNESSDPGDATTHLEQLDDYLNRLCKDFVRSMKDMIDAGVAERASTDDHLVDECCQHIRFCQSKCEGFKGRQATLQLIQLYVQGISSNALVLHGTSGTGKTSIMAMAAKMMKQWTVKPAALVLRFLGTSPDSSSLMPLLDSLTSQIRRIYKLPTLPASVANLETRVKQFKEALAEGKPERPLIVMLDSLDQLDPAYDARKLGWLIVKLAPGTRVIVSTLPEPVYECFSALRSGIRSESNFVSVPVLDNTGVRAILDNWLTMRHRCLTDHQMTVVLNAFQKCQTPLFLKLSFEEAATWSSFLSEDKTVLQDTVRASIDFLFQKLEKVHGKMLVSRALGYLTIANNGATEAELEDILSCDDDVLNDVYMYWTPPVRRLPPLLMVRVKTDLDQYLVERGADGVRVVYWYHRQFIEAAEARYCSDEATNKLMHEILADIFNGTWASGKKKPFTNAKGQSGEEDRHVSLQPLKFGPGNYNLRTLNNLPFHRTHAGQVALLKDQCLANPTFLINKLEATSINSVLRDYTLAKEVACSHIADELINNVLQALYLSKEALTTDPRQLVPQLIQRLEHSPVTETLLERCKQYPSTYLLPNTCVLERPGGQLVQTVAAHKGLTTMDMTTDGNHIVTVCREDQEVTLWETHEWKKTRDVQCGEVCVRAVFCNHDNWLACGLQMKMIIQEVETGVSVMTLYTNLFDHTFSPLGKGRTFIMMYKKEDFKLFNLQTDFGEGNLFAHPEKLKFDKWSLRADSSSYLVLTSAASITAMDQHLISVYDLHARKFRPHFRAFSEDPVKAIMIPPDEAYLICYSAETGDVVFVDFDGNNLKTIPPPQPDERRKFTSLSMTPNGSHLYMMRKKNPDAYLSFFDAKTLQPRGLDFGKLEVKGGFTTAITHDCVNVITVSDDGKLSVWDRTRREVSTDESDQLTTKLHCLDTAHVLTNPRYVLLCGPVGNRRGGHNTPRLLEVYDVFNNTTVISGRLTKEHGPTYTDQFFNTKNEHQVILVLGEQQILRYDLQARTVVKTYDGLTTKVAMAADTEEIFCTTQDGRNIKLYDANGDLVSEIKTEEMLHILDRIVYVQVNDSGTVGCAATQRFDLMLFDIKCKKHMYNIDAEEYHRKGHLLKPILNQAGTRFVFSPRFGGHDLKSDFDCGKIHVRSSDEEGNPCDEKQLTDDFGQLVIWDIQARKEIRRRYSSEGPEAYTDDSYPHSLRALDDTRFLSIHADNVIRVWNFHTGDLLTQMRGHASCPRVSLCPRSPYMLTYSSLGEDSRSWEWEENCFRLWDKVTYRCVASFSLEKKADQVVWSGDGKCVTTVNLETPELTVWTIHHGHDHMTFREQDYPHTFSQEAE